MTSREFGNADGKTKYLSPIMKNTLELMRQYPALLDKRNISDLEWELCAHSAAIESGEWAYSWEYSTAYDFGEYVKRCARCGARIRED